MADKIIALTGGIGSGKSLALKILTEAGYGTVSCDEITAALYKKRKIKKKIAEIFPSAASGRLFIGIDKRAVAKEAFSDAVKREKLNAFLHPLILEKAINVARKKKGKTAFVEVPLLFESKSEGRFDGVIVIMRNLKDRRDSVKKRSSITEEEIMDRVKSQFDYNLTDTEKYAVIYNDKDIEKFSEEVIKTAKEF